MEQVSEWEERHIYMNTCISNHGVSQLLQSTSVPIMKLGFEAEN